MAGKSHLSGDSVPATEPPPPRDRCWHDGRQFCYSWEEDAELRPSLEPPAAPGTECYGVRWTPLRPDVTLKDCFSMANVSWYGGPSIRAQHWPLNGAESPAQPLVSGDLSANPDGFGPLLERYFLGSTGVTVTVAPDVSLLLSLESHQQFCLETPAGREEPLHYQLCVSADVAIPLLTTWKGQLCARLNVTSEAALGWYLARARRLRQALGAAYVAFEGVEGNSFLEQDVPAPAELEGDRYTEALAAALATLGNGTVISAGSRSSHLPLFVQMSPLRSDWSHAGLKGLIPSVLHYSLLGYNFFIPDAVGGSEAGATPGDPELFVRWLQIVTFLPVMAFGTPPWLCCDTWVLNLTRQCIQRHRDFVVPLLLKYSEEWQSLGYPIFRPAWWLSPTDPVAFTIEDEFLIGDEVLVAPITEKGQTWRDIYLPGEGHLWLDTNTARVFDGGTTLRNYSASLAEVPVFVKTS
ncbi:SITS-binding protein-like [Geospiza fortis]|uniref:SITS-binding protein-like n=1 Tax=Geospiza fortis TaxID=48883 RepID=A0A6I9Z8Z8_GEOFO|nr:SITS-binding protein-like [Geospiza fortis]